MGLCCCICHLQMNPSAVLFPTMYNMLIAMLQSRIKSGVGSERNACHFLRLTAQYPFFRDKIAVFNVLRQNGTVLHNNKNECFTEHDKQRERERSSQSHRFSLILSPDLLNKP